MRRHKTHTVTRGQLTGEGKTKSEARADLERQIDRALSPYGLWMETRHGCVLIVASTLSGFETKVLFPQDIVVHGMRHWSGCHMSGLDIRDAVMSVRMHAAQSIWTADHDDAQLIADSGLDNTRELESWIRFQRSYIAHKANGMTDAQAHAMSCH